MSDLRPIGLRDRKRQETRSRLERAAIDIVLSDGLDALTIDAVSERADVSPRTFFNYFDSKEDAVLGLHDPELSDEVLGAHVERAQGGDIIESVIRLLFGILGPSLGDGELHRARMRILQQYPHLLGRQMAQMNRMLERLTTAVVSLMAGDERFSTTDATRRAAWAQVVLMMCGSGIRASVKEWAHTAKATPPDELERRALLLVHEVRERLQ